MENPRKRITFSTVESTVELILKNPRLLTVPSFSVLRPIVDLLRNGHKACGCDVNQTYQRYRPQFERAVTGLTSADADIIKRLLDVDQICYFTRSSNSSLERICL